MKYFLDCMHQIDPEPTDITTILEVLDLVHSEGKTKYDSFETVLSQGSPKITDFIVFTFVPFYSMQMKKK